MKKLVISTILKKATGKTFALFVIYLILKFSGIYLQRMAGRLSVAALVIKKILQS